MYLRVYNQKKLIVFQSADLEIATYLIKKFYFELMLSIMKSIVFLITELGFE